MPDGSGIVIFEGHAIVGGTGSFTVTENEQVIPPPMLHVTIVVPTAKTEPLVGEHVTLPQPPAAAGVG